MIDFIIKCVDNLSDSLVELADKVNSVSYFADNDTNIYDENIVSVICGTVVTVVCIIAAVVFLCFLICSAERRSAKIMEIKAKMSAGKCEKDTDEMVKKLVKEFFDAHKKEVENSVKKELDSFSEEVRAILGKKDK